MAGELLVKDQIEQRLKEYIDVVQNELRTAKRILANPKLRESAYKEINFEKVYYYSYTPKTKEEGAYQKDFDK